MERMHQETPFVTGETGMVGGGGGGGGGVGGGGGGGGGGGDAILQHEYCLLFQVWTDWYRKDLHHGRREKYRRRNILGRGGGEVEVLQSLFNFISIPLSL